MSQCTPTQHNNKGKKSPSAFILNAYQMFQYNNTLKDHTPLSSCFHAMNAGMVQHTQNNKHKTAQKARIKHIGQ
jgi:hypothetical protein